MAQTDSTADTGTDQDNASGMRLEVREYDSTDDDKRVVETTTYSHREWWEDGPNGQESAWAALAKQATDDLEVSTQDDEELVLIGVMGYLNDDQWDKMLDMRGFNGRQWTFATVTPVDAVDDDVGKPDDPPVDEWAHDPLYDGTRKGASFNRVKATGDSRRSRSQWRTDKWGFSYPKAADLVIVRAVGTPTALDRETLTKSQGYPTDDDGLPDYSGEWSYDRMVETARENLADRQEREEHTFDRSARVEALMNELDAEGVDDQLAGTLLGALMGGHDDGRRQFVDGHDDAVTIDDVDALTDDATYTAAEGTIKWLLRGLDEDDQEALVQLVTDSDGEADDD